jgi:PGF-pre-PGF domain-containing protein
MDKKNRLSTLFLIMIIALFAYLAFADTGDPVLTNPVVNQNVSGNLLVNVTTSFNALYGNFSNVTVYLANATNNSRQDIVLTRVLTDNDTAVNLTFNITLDTTDTSLNLEDGLYNITLNATNSTDDSITTIDNISLTAADLVVIDNTVPAVTTINSPVANTTYTNSYDTLVVFNVSASNNTGHQSGSQMHVVLFSLTNGSNSSGTVNQINNTSSSTDQAFWNVSINLSGMAEGFHTMTVYANDTAGNSNSSVSTTFYIDGTAPTVNLLDPLNASWTDTRYTFNFSDGTSPNASCELLVDDTGYGINSTVLNDTNTVLVANASITAGVHNWTVNCTDLATNTGATTIDAIDVLVVNVTSPLNDSFTSETRPGNVSFQFNFLSVLVTSTLLDDNVTCELFIANSSGNAFIANGVNTTSLNNTVMTITNNQSLLGDLEAPNGVGMNWTANCTYNGSTIGVETGQLTLNIDNVTPSTPTLTKNTASSSSTSLTIDIATSVDAISCTDTDPGSSITKVSSGNFKLVEGNLAGDTSYSYEVTCSDSASNSAISAVTAFTTDASSSSGSSGSGGGTGSAVTGQFAKKNWASINEGESAKIPVTNGAIGVTEVTFKVGKTTYGAWVKVEKVDSLPSSVSSFSGGEVYKNVKITQNNVEKAIEGNAMVDFKVTKAWLSSKNLGKGRVSLFRFVGDEWVELSTTIGKDDGTYIHYVAETPGFSYFVIGEKMQTAKPTAVAEDFVVTDEGVVGGETAVVDEVSGEAPVVVEKKSALVWLIPVLLLVVLGGAVLVYLKKR